MNEAQKRWVKKADLIPPSERPVGLEHHPVTTLLATSTLPIPTRAIRKISRNATPSCYVSRRLPED